MGITVYYWPFLGRGASLVRMLEHTGTAYEYVSDKTKFPASAFGQATGDTFAPPILVDGDVSISQSVATCLYLGEKLGLKPAGYNVFKATQHCMDIVDTFENNLGKKNEDGAVLAEFLKGSRFESLMGNLERGIKGPYYYGDEPSAVDFFLLQHLDWRCSQVFDPLKARGYDALAPYPKICAIQAALQAADGYKNYKGLVPPGPLKPEIVDAFFA